MPDRPSRQELFITTRSILEPPRGVHTRMLDLAEALLPGLGASYLAPRLGRYAYAIQASVGEGLAAFQLIDEFEEDGARHLYLGPLFSRGGAAGPLVAGFLLGLLAEARPFHLMTEVENPEVALMVKALFPRSSCPDLVSLAIPAETRRIASAFSRRLGHIESLDLETLATRPGESLYVPRPGCEPVLRWLEERRVHLDAGHSQAFLITCGDPARQGPGMRAELLHGLRCFGQWALWRPRLMALFERHAHVA